MPLYTPSRAAQRFLGDSKAKVVHDLLNEQPECGALDIIAARRGERFTPDSLEYALSEAVGYKACPHCLAAYVVEEPEPEPEAEDGAAEGAGGAGAAETAEAACSAESDITSTRSDSTTATFSCVEVSGASSPSTSSAEPTRTPSRGE